MHPASGMDWREAWVGPQTQRALINLTKALWVKRVRDSRTLICA